MTNPKQTHSNNSSSLEEGVFFYDHGGLWVLMPQGFLIVVSDPEAVVEGQTITFSSQAKIGISRISLLQNRAFNSAADLLRRQPGLVRPNIISGSPQMLSLSGNTCSYRISDQTITLGVNLAAAGSMTDAILSWYLGSDIFHPALHAKAAEVLSDKSAAAEVIRRAAQDLRFARDFKITANPRLTDFAPLNKAWARVLWWVSRLDLLAKCLDSTGAGENKEAMSELFSLARRNKCEIANYRWLGEWLGWPPLDAVNPPAESMIRAWYGHLGVPEPEEVVFIQSEKASNMPHQAVPMDARRIFHCVATSDTV